jgi:hypothetical protein
VHSLFLSHPLRKTFHTHPTPKTKNTKKSAAKEIKHDGRKGEPTKKSTTQKQRLQQRRASNRKTTKSKDTGIPCKRKSGSDDKLQTLKAPHKSTEL